MIGIPLTSNSIYVSKVPNGCCKTEFDSAYPVHLNGIISQEEYQASIARINQSASLKILSTFIWIMFTIVFSLGILSCIYGFVMIHILSLSSFFIVGIMLILFGPIVTCVGGKIKNRRRIIQIRKAVAEESMRYSTRSPIPCSWRLETTTSSGERCGSRRKVVDHIIIDIGRLTVSRNATNYPSQDVNELQMLYSPQDPSAPPPYSSQSAVICTHCGVSPLDLTANFCSSCGHASSKQ